MSGTAASIEASIPSVISQTILRRKYECRAAGNRLVFADMSSNGTQFVSDVSHYLPLEMPKLTKRGKIAARQPQIQSQPQSWWKAQCAFRGLPVGGTTAELQQQLRQYGTKGFSPTIRDGFENMERDYNERIWNRLDDDGKVAALPKRFLEEALGANGSRREEVLVVKVKDWAESITAAARSLGIAYESHKMPGFETGQRLVVVGNDRLRVRSKAAEHEREVEREAQRTRKRLDQEQKAREREAQEAQAALKKDLKAARLKDKNLKGGWDVRGTWTIGFPYVEEQWRDEAQALNLVIGYTEPDRDGSAQIYADFDFGILTGVMRFIDSDSKDSRQFRLSKSSLPSSSSKKFSFRWRGEDTSEGVIQLGSDTQLCSLTFESPHAFTGVLKGGFIGEEEFTGIKTSSRGAQLDVEYSWAQRSEDAYEEARVGRWR